MHTATELQRIESGVIAKFQILTLCATQYCLLACLKNKLCDRQFNGSLTWGAVHKVFVSKIVY